MRVHRVWIEIVLIAVGIAFALALLLASIGAAAGIAEGEVAGSSAPTKAESFDGMITCSRCGARHRPAFNQSAATCVRVCVHGGASFALVEGDSVYLLDGKPVSLKRFARQARSHRRRTNRKHHQGLFREIRGLARSSRSLLRNASEEFGSNENHHHSAAGRCWSDLRNAGAFIRPKPGS